MRRVFGPPPIDRIAWPEACRRMEDGSRFRWFPHQVEPYANLHDPDVWLTVIVWASRCGKTELVLNEIGANIAGAGDPAHQKMIYAMPTEGSAMSSSKLLQAQLIDPTPDISVKIPNASGQRNANNTILNKRFGAAGELAFVGLNSLPALRRVSSAWQYLDETDSVTIDAKGEGDPVMLLHRRSASYPNATRVMTSYPSRRGKSRIWDYLERSDMQQWHTQCPHCQAWHVLDRQRDIVWDDGKPETARLIAPCCKKEIAETAWRKMVAAGKWQSTQEFAGIRGYHAGALNVWPHPTETAYPSFFAQLATLAEQAKRADRPEAAEEALVTTVDAIPYDAPSDTKPEPDRIIGRLETFDPYDELPSEVVTLTCGVDVNKRFLAYGILGFGANGEMWVLDVGELGTQSINNPEVWRRLDDLILRKWRHPDGTNKTISLTLVDSNYRPTVVRPWCDQRRRRGVMAIVGSNQVKTPLIGAMVKGKAVPRLGVNDGKDELYQRLMLEPDSDGEYPYGFIHLPMRLGPEFVRRLTVEDSETVQVGGKFYRQFFTRGDQRSEELDVVVYAMAAERMLNHVYDDAHTTPDDETPTQTRAPAAPDIATLRRRSRKGGRGRSPFISA
jgi:phage terminase large subunit GpA-like protein